MNNFCSKTHILAFDVDDTLAHSGQPLTPEMCNALDNLAFLQGYQLAFITSRSYAELEERIPENILRSAYAFTCMGMEFWHQGKMEFQHHFSWPKGLEKALHKLVDACGFPDKTGQHIVKRPCKGALSLLGENHKKAQREAFIKWNKKTNFLNTAANYLQMQYPSLDVQAFGKTSIDFSDQKMSKAVMLPHLRKEDSRHVVFFGDSMQPEGNDFELKQALEDEREENKCLWVNNPDETYRILTAIIRS